MSADQDLTVHMKRTLEVCSHYPGGLPVRLHAMTVPPLLARGLLRLDGAVVRLTPEGRAALARWRASRGR